MGRARPTQAVIAEPLPRANRKTPGSALCPQLVTCEQHLAVTRHHALQRALGCRPSPGGGFQVALPAEPWLWCSQLQQGSGWGFPGVGEPQGPAEDWGQGAVAVPSGAE